MSKYYVVKYSIHNDEHFTRGTIVKHCTSSSSQNCHLVKNINTNELKWLMTYDIYPIINHNNFLDWSYNETYQNLIPSDYYIIKNKNMIVKLLNNNNVLDLNTNNEFYIDKGHLIKANEYIP